MPSFNLVEEQWMPCVFLDGSPGTVGIRDALVNSHAIKEITDSSPLVVVALLRLMLAMLRRCCGPKDMDQWTLLWRAGRWDDSRLSMYFEKWHDRFDLFDEARPFYQSKELTGAEKHPVLHLAMEISSGNNATLFDHSSDETPAAVDPDVAARYVIATQSYSIGFGKSVPFYFSDTPLVRGLTVLVLGDNLFQTLALNLVEYNEHLPFERRDDEEDVPVWEQDDPAEPQRAGTPIKGYLDYLTWQSRNIHLFAEGDPPVVRWCQIQQRLKLPKQQYLDPFKCFQRDRESGFVPRGVRPDKAVWRDSHALFQQTTDDFKRPEVFNWMARIESRRRDGQIQAKPAYSFIATGLATDPGKAGSVLLWRQERLPVALAFLDDQDLVAKLKEALGLAEETAKLLGPGFVEVEAKGKRLQVPSPMRVLAQEILPKDQQGKADPDAVKAFVGSLSPARPYWASLGLHFNRLVTELAGDKSLDGEYGANALPWWAGEVRKAARQAFREATDGLDHSGRWLRAVAIAEDSFSRRLGSTIKEFLEPYEPETE